MTETRENTSQQYHSCHIKGESIPLWVPSVLALLGTISSIFIAQSLLPSQQPVTDLPIVRKQPLEHFRITKQQRTGDRQAVLSRANTSAEINALPRIQERIAKGKKQDQRLPAPAPVEKTAVPTKAPPPVKAIPGNARQPVQQLPANPPAQQHSVNPMLPPEKQAPAIVTAETNADIPEKPTPATTAAKKSAEAVGTTIPQASKITASRTSKLPTSVTSKETAKSSHRSIPTGKSTAVTTHHPPTVRHPSSPRDCPALFFISFPIGSETPSMQHLSPKIRRLKHWLWQHPDKKVIIEGHTDSYGPEEFNLLLSYRRAKAAEGILLEAGIPGNQLLVRALGEEEPVPGLPAKSRKNRVASIRVETPQGCINNFINGDIN